MKIQYLLLATEISTFIYCASLTISNFELLYFEFLFDFIFFIEV